VSARPGGTPAEVIIGVDVGTTAAKVSAFGIGTRWRYTAVREYPLLRPRPGWEVQQPEVLVDAVLAALAETVANCGGGTVLALALSSAMHGLIGLDEQQRPLTPLITWADSRAVGEAAELRGAGLARTLLERSGTPVHSMAPLPKLIWFRRHEPELFRRVRHWVGLKDWVLLALTGTLGTELSSASGTGLLDLSTDTWSAPSLELAGIDPSQLPPVLATTAALELGAAIAGRVGLPTATPVVLGAGDGPLGNLGSGAIRPGVAGLSLGTSGAIRALAPRTHLDRAGGLFRYALTRDDWVVGGAISNGGSVQRWAGDVFGGNLPAGNVPAGNVPGRAAGAMGADDAALLRLAAAVPAGSDGLVALPYLMAERAPLWDPTLTGAFLGVRNQHTRGHFVRACIEGVALQLWTILAQLEAVVPVTSLRATGGVFRSPLWSRVLTDVLDRPVTVTDGAEGSALGAAALGLIGIGRANSLQAALDLLRPDAGSDADPMLPDPAAVATYRGVRTRIPQLLGSYADVAALFAGPTEPEPAGAAGSGAEPAAAAPLLGSNREP